jgi:hypothetical protein
MDNIKDNSETTEQFLLHLVDVVSSFTSEQAMYFSTQVRKELVEEARKTFDNSKTIERDRRELSTREKALVKSYVADLIYNGHITVSMVKDTFLDPRNWNPHSTRESYQILLIDETLNNSAEDSNIC